MPKLWQHRIKKVGRGEDAATRPQSALHRSGPTPLAASVPPEQASILLQLKNYSLTLKQLTNNKGCIRTQTCCPRSSFGYSLGVDDVFPFGAETALFCPPQGFVLIDCRWGVRSYTAGFSFR